MSKWKLKNIGGVCLLFGIAFLFWTHPFANNSPVMRVKSAAVPVSEAARDQQNRPIKTYFFKSTETAAPPSFESDPFYRTIIDNNLFRPLGWRPPPPQEPYRLLGTRIPADGNPTEPQAIIQFTAGNHQIQIVTIGDNLGKDTTVTAIHPKSVTLKKNGQQRHLHLNTLSLWLR